MSNDTPVNHPDPKLHLYISLVKSAVRIGAGLALILAGYDPLITTAGALLLFAELLGIAEELV